MSNLYKQRYVISDTSSKRVINSNSRVEQRMQELQREMQAQMQMPDLQGAVDGFVQGLQMEVVDAVPKEPEISPEEIRRMAQEEARDLLADAQNQAEAILGDAQNQAEAIREEARSAGYQAGHQEGSSKAEATLAELRSQMEEERRLMEEDYQQKIQELEPYLVDVVANIFEQVFHVQFDDKKEILIYLIQKVILNAEGTKDFQVRVSLKDYGFVEEHKSQIAELVGESVHIEIMADASLVEHQCMIETDSGVFECGIDVQLEGLIKALKSLSL